MTIQKTSTGRMVALGACALIALSLTGCGGGGAAADPGFAGTPAGMALLEIEGATFPTARPGAAFGPYPIEVDGATGPVRFEVLSGALPPGVSLRPDGLLLGTPGTFGVFDFRIGAQDGTTADAEWFSIEVRSFDIRVEGLQHGDAWSGLEVEVATTSTAGSASYDFEVVENGSGGSLQRTTGDHAGYVPGNVLVEGVLDRIRVTDSATGEAWETTLRVCPDPLVEHDAEWGTSDVWFVDFVGVKRGGHPFSCDWHAGLARLGLRHSTSTGEGRIVDQLADMACRVAVLRELNRIYQRNGDGSRGNGFDISFPYDEPTAPFERPDRFLTGRPTAYSVMPVCDTSEAGALGIAFVDGVDNGLHIDNTPKADIDRGVFLNRILDQAIPAYGRYGDALLEDPIGDRDVEALRAVLYDDTATVGGRHEVVLYVVNGLARSVAAVLAHEIGHGLGLTHKQAEDGSMMSASTAIAEDAVYAFSEASREHLRAALPGPGRAGGGTLALAADGSSGEACCDE